MLFSFFDVIVLSCRCTCCLWIVFFFFFKQKTAYEMRISDWSSDVCSSDLGHIGAVTVAVLVDNPECRAVILEPLPENIAAIHQILDEAGVADRAIVIYGGRKSVV